MKRAPIWLVWSGLALVVWIAAGWLTWGVLAPRATDLRAEEEELNREHAAAEALVAAAPRVVAEIDSVETEIRHHLARLTSTDEIPHLLSALEAEGARHKLDALRTELGLHSTMSIPLEVEPGTESQFTTHSLRLTLAVQGTFAAIGSWLDAVEDRADFHEWIVCRWEHKADAGHISFTGEAEFWVITTPDADAATSGDPSK